jgi:uncharacterized protein GlcG (DUF336 family)
MVTHRKEGNVVSNGIVTRAEVALDLAEQLLWGVRSEAGRRGLFLAAVVVDRGGQVVAAIRMDGAQICAVPLAIGKAYAAVACAAPTDAWEETTQPGGRDWGLNTALGGRLIVFAGGLPIVHDGELIGGLGVSGAASSDDKACAQVALHLAGLVA